MVVLGVEGKLQGSDAMQMSRKLEALKTKKQNTIVVDLCQVIYLDSRWLGVFVYSWRTLREAGKELVFVIPQGDVYSFFRDANLDTYFRIVHTPEQLGL